MILWFDDQYTQGRREKEAYTLVRDKSQML